MSGLGGATPEGSSRRDIGARIRQVVEAILGRAADEHTSFLDLGLTSLALGRVRVRLEREHGLTLSDTDLFEHPTIAALTGHLASDADEAGAPARARGRDAGDLPDDAQRVAVIGMAVRFPGADDVDRFWANLRTGVCSVSTFPDARPPVDPDHRPVAGVLRDVDCFDADYFGMNAREAELTDPAHRIFLECAEHALEHAGYADTGRARNVGVFAGGGMNLYGPRPAFHARFAPADGSGAGGIAEEMQALIGGQYDFLASRVAYRLGLTGAAVGVQTACSTGLVAVHLAVQSLLSGDVDLALAGAAAVHLPQEAGYRHQPEFIMSPTGRCRAFDAASDGTVGGNGVAAVVLKRLDRARADGDTVHAVVIGSAVNNDGSAKAGFTAPGLAGHTDVVRRALARAGVAPGSISYVEAHGTGTPLGDPVEFEALSRAYRSEGARAGSCALGAVKPNIGHLDTCAGMAGLIKTVLMLRHREIVPTVNVTRPSPRLPWADSPFHLATAGRPWTGDGAPLRASVSALGFGGTNAHVVLEEAAAVDPSPAPESAVRMPLSARDADSLRALATRLRDHLSEHRDLSAADVQTTLGLGRAQLPYRAVISGRSPGELADALDRVRQDRGHVSAAPAAPVAFAFAGQGSSAPGMARRLHAEFPVVRDTLDECAALLGPEQGRGLLNVLLHPSAGDPPPGVAQPALFALQSALARQWRSFGVEPDYTIGHSLGEIAALCDAGGLTLADGLGFTAARGRLMGEGVATGAMLAIVADEDTARRIGGMAGVDLAAANGPRAQVLSGSAENIRAAQAICGREGVACRQLAADLPFHSARIDPILDALRDEAEKLTFLPLHTPWAGGANGELLAVGTVLDADFLTRQARRPVLFHRALGALDAVGCHDFLEIGPGDVLTGIARSGFSHTRWTGGRTADETVVWDALASLYRRGIPVAWERIATTGHRIPLPGYPFRRRSFPIPEPAGVAANGPSARTRTDPPEQPAADHPQSRVLDLAGRQLDLVDTMIDEVTGLLSAQLSVLSDRDEEFDRR
ncbi:acyltransferase domain-containing protein [Embleya sp. NBC_00888]|uniref:type I polyketide synthase n=1 Tax=Embleya sp. NBC_00888 TaxID=2975960 RepID=UPI00386303E8|nr:acyltransferase domain-containing protein [Embleya sp. NBC_00888]